MKLSKLLAIFCGENFVGESVFCKSLWGSGW